MKIVEAFNNINCNVGATICYPGYLPEIVCENGYTLRSEKLKDGRDRNMFLGSVVTHPFEEVYVISDVYLDYKDLQCDETFFLYNSESGKWDRLEGKELEKRFAKFGIYNDAHKGDKKYLAVGLFLNIIRKLK